MSVTKSGVQGSGFRVRGAFTLILVLAMASSAAAQRGARAIVPDAAAIDGGGVSPAEIQRMFDSYALIQAQDQLKISDEKFPQFLTRFKALQDSRRRAMQERSRRINELRRLSNDAEADEAAVKEQLKGLDDLDVRAQAEVLKSYEAINQVLDLRQQAKFRVFEENMENRKLALVMRARQANRPKL